MAYLSIQDTTETSITIRIYGLTYAPDTYGGFRFSINGGGWSSVQSGWGANIKMYSGLSCGTYYSFAAQAQWNGVWYDVDGVGGYTSSCYIPPPGTPSISLNSRTSTSITINVSLGGNTSYAIVTLTGTGKSAYAYSNGTVTFTGLSPSTTYTAVVTAYGSGGTTSGTSISVSTTASFTPFSWGITISAGQPAAITWTKWAELQAGINNKRTSKGLSSYSFSVSSAGSTINSSLANQLLTATSPMSSSLPSSVSSGTDITASWLNQFTNAYNAIT